MIGNYNYNNVRINDSVGFTDKDGNHTNDIERFWGYLKKSVGYISSYEDLSDKLMQFKALEYIKRSNKSIIMQIIKNI